MAGSAAAGVEGVKCVVFAVGGRYVYEVAEILRRLDWEVSAYVSNRPEAPLPEGLEPVVDSSELPDGLTDLAAVIPIGTPGHRHVAVSEARELGFNAFPAVVDPNSTVAKSAIVDSGVIVNAGVIVAARSRLTEFASINRGTSIGHDANIGAFTFLGPGVIVCGGVEVGRGTLIGAGAILNPDVTIGENSVVGSGSVVTRDIPGHTLVVGNPARVVRDSIPGPGGVSV